MFANLALFPPNGLDRSLHAAVLIGLALSTLFTETLGWTYAGLVVPGYLATVFFAAPVTGVFIVAEAIATYLLVALIGRWITRTGVWSTAFGRERFYLFIVGAVVVRLLVEGAVVPRLAVQYDLARSRELYSVGLVLVPLLANAFWNSGLARAAPRVAVVTALTALVLALLLRTTNLSVSRFQVLNESLSLAFLESPKAHLILVIGALMGARNNVRYGWDYNGILVPGLLAVAWYEPTKLVTTTVEALLVYYLSRGITSVRPFSRMLLVGPRRMLFVYIVGFLVKVALGFATARYAPGVQMIDYFGFGYLLPSLLAVKMWNKEHVGIVIMPTLQVSLAAFLLGNALGYVMVAVGSGEPEAAQAPAAARAPVVESAAFSLLLADTAPRPGPRPSPAALAADVEARRLAHRVAREVVQGGEPSLEAFRAASLAGLAIEREAEGERPWFVIAGRLSSAEDAPTAPRAALRARARARARRVDGGRGPSDRGRGWLVLAAPAAPGSALPVVALRIAEMLDAPGVVLLSRHVAVRQHDAAFAAAMVDALDGAQVLLIESAGGAAPSLSVVGSPAGLPVVAIGEALGAPVSLAFRSAGAEAGVLSDAPRLRVPDPVAEAVGASTLRAPDVLRWPRSVEEELEARMLELTSVEPGRYRAPSIEELRLFDAVVAPRLLRGAAGDADAPPAPWELAVMGRLGYRAVRIGPDPAAAWGIVEPSPQEGGAERRGNATWLVLPKARARAGSRRNASSTDTSSAAPVVGAGGSPAGPGAGLAAPEALLIEVPAPRWQVGTFGAGVAVADALQARALMLAGAMPTADPGGASDVRRKEGLQSYYQRLHELWIGGGRHALSIQAIEADRSYDRDAVISFGREVVRREHVPPFAAPLLESLRDLDLRVGLFDGTREQVPFSAATDVGMSYAKRFAEGRFGVVFLGSAVRRFFELRRFAAQDEGELRLDARLRRLDFVPASADVAARALELASCAARAPAGGPACPTAALPRAGCDLDAAIEGYRRYAAQRNPYYLRAQMETQRGAARARGACHVEVDRDAATGRLWALAARPGEVRLLPLDAVLVGTAGAPLSTLPRLRRAIALGTSAIRVVDAPPAAATSGAAP